MNSKNKYLIPLISLIFIIICTVPVQAYYLTLDAPAEVRVGESFTVNGTTNTPPPDQIDIIFSQSINIPVEKARESIQITEKGDTEFNVTFDTAGYDKGNYKIEALSESQRDFSAGSHSLRVIKLIDRTEEVRITSPTYQEFTGTLLIEARISDYDDNAIQMEVKKGDETIFGPESVPVDKKVLSQEIPIKSSGLYTLSLTDYTGYIGSYDIQVGESEKPKPSVTATPAVSETVSPQTQNATPTTKPVSASKKEIEIVNPSSLKTEVSRDSPAYIRIAVDSTPLVVKTSDNEDWVVEYKTSPDDAAIKVNDELGEATETFTISDTVSDLYVKVYPYSYSTSAEVELTAGPSSVMELSDDAATAFNAPPRYNTQPTESPLPFWIIIAGLICALYIIRR